MYFNVDLIPTLFSTSIDGGHIGSRYYIPIIYNYGRILNKILIEKFDSVLIVILIKISYYGAYTAVKS